jgi:glycosyltransferase involved in cell wall biosynthesis
MVTSGHAPGDDRIFYKEARSLVRAGADVTVLYPAGKNPPTAAAGVRFEGHAGGGGWARRLHSVGKIAEGISSERYDVVHCHEPDSLAAAMRARGDRPAKVIYDSHELWGGTFAERFPRPFWPAAQATFQRWERPMVARCNGAIGASWAISDFLADIVGRDRVRTILNVPAAEVFGPGTQRGWGATTILCHDGHLSFNRGLKTMIEAVRIVASKHQVVLKIVGDVYNEERVWLEAYIRKHGLEGVIVRTGWLPYEQVGSALSQCHIGLVALQRTPNNVVTSSNKVFNYMLYGIPFIGPDFRLSKIKLAKEDHCGILADSSDARSYASAICRLIEDRQGTEVLAANALKASLNKYRWEHMEPVLFELYEQVMGRRPRGE